MSVENINLFHSVLGEALERLGKKNLNLKESQYEAVKAVVVERKDTICLTGKFANCAPEISKIYYKIYREHQNCAAEISVAQYKLSRLDDLYLAYWLWKVTHIPASSLRL